MNLELIPRPDLDHYELAKDLCAQCPPHGEFWVPAGFHYDGASIPTPVWQMIYTPFAPDVMRAALVHDWLYHAHEDNDGDGKRRLADDVFYEILKQDGVSKAKRELMWGAVRNFGGTYWENDADSKAFLTELFQKHSGDGHFEKFRFPTWARQPT